MIYRTPKMQADHDHLVGVVVSYLVQRGYRNIRADLPGHAQPACLLGTKQDHIPDITADGLIVEVETSDTIDSAHTTSQWALFSDYATKYAQTFWVVVPHNSVAAAQNRLGALGLQAEVYGA
jgi:hypothetical protein